MRSLLLLAATLPLVACEAPAPEPDDRPLVVVTYNIMCAACAVEGLDTWTQRTPFHAQIIQEHAPDLIGLQEQFLYDDVQLTLSDNPDYDALFYIDDGGGLFEVYPDAAIYYRRDRFEPVDNGVFWLSETPDTPFSKGFADGAQLPRLVVWALLRQVTDDRLVLFATTHVDNNSPSQELSAPLFVDHLTPLADGAPIVLVGDFNSTPSTTAYGILTASFTDTFTEVDAPVVMSNEDPARAWDEAERIDHVFLAGPLMQTDDWTVDVRVFGERPAPPSDHYPVIVKLAF